jgi:hypothetical protein
MSYSIRIFEWYRIPKCKTCGSLLVLNDMDTDTEKNCCEKGSRKAEAQNYYTLPSNDDDILF